MKVSHANWYDVFVLSLFLIGVKLVEFSAKRITNKEIEDAIISAFRKTMEEIGE